MHTRYRISKKTDTLIQILPLNIARDEEMNLKNSIENVQHLLERAALCV